MVKVLITGTNSYIGTAVEKWLLKKPNMFAVTTIDMKDNSWNKKSFSDYDVVFHVAGIAHDTKNKKKSELYYRVNRDLAIEVAKKAKEAKVKHFIFMSSMLVYNGCKEKKIGKYTIPFSKGSYATSKLQADLEIQKMNSDDFAVSVLRPPMVFGPNCKGNFPRLAKLAKKCLLFPEFHNIRSMLYIDNLCEFIKKIIILRVSGVLFPQNESYFCTSQIIRVLAKEYNRKVRFTKVLNWLLCVLIHANRTFSKVFGDYVYDQSTVSSFDYIIVNNIDSIRGYANENSMDN